MPEVRRGVSDSYRRRAGFRGIDRRRCLLGWAKKWPRPRPRLLRLATAKNSRRPVPPLPPPKSGKSSSCVRTDTTFMGRPVCRAGRANVRSAARDFAFPSLMNRKWNRNRWPSRRCPPSRKSCRGRDYAGESNARGRARARPIGATAGFLAGAGWRRFRAGEDSPAPLGDWRRRFSICLGFWRRSRAAHPLAALFIELWAARGEGSRVEVHLESGSVLLPDGYLKSHSQQDYAVLVTGDPDGCSTITVVPWKSISRIIMRAVKQVPGEVVR